MQTNELFKARLTTALFAISLMVGLISFVYFKLKIDVLSDKVNKLEQRQ